MEDLKQSPTRDEYVFLGRVIGTASGWDQQDTFAIILYDFSPAKGIPISGGDITFDFESGRWMSYTNEGETLQEGDLIEALKNAARHKA